LSPVHCAYAKINLGLYVLDRRDDGFHNIRTIFHRIDLHDDIRLEAAAALEVVSSSPDAPGDDSNLCFKAARALQELTGTRNGVRIHLDKRIPVGAGLGGGSSDAATVLRVLPAFWHTAVAPEVIRTLAARLGSDVPYFLGISSAVAGGRGEVLDYFTLDIPHTILLCHPGIHVSTARAYGEIHHRGTPPADLRGIVERGVRNPVLLREELRNDFEETVFTRFPVIRRVRDAMTAGGAVYASMSGSGSAVYGMFSDPRRAAASAVELQAEGFGTWLTPPHFQSPE
jgi:4-diphosphocytidyl-2-C-methyl-D-erythritol kinase